MPTRDIEIPGVGTFAVPDDWSVPQIEEYVQRDILKLPELRTAPAPQGEITQAATRAGEYLMGGYEGLLGKAMELLGRAAPTAVRLGSQMVAKTPLMGALLAPSGENIAQSIEIGTGRRGQGEMDERAMASSSFLGAFMPQAGQTLWQGIKRGAGVGAVNTAVDTAIREGRLPTAGEAAVGIGAGAVVGGGIGKFNQVMSNRVEARTQASELSRVLGRPVDPRSEYDMLNAMKEAQTKADFEASLRPQMEANITGATESDIGQLAGMAPSAELRPPPFLGGQDVTGETLANFQVMPPSPSATSLLLRSAQDTLRTPAGPEPAPVSPTSSLLSMAQRTLTGQGGGSNIFGDWARRIVDGGEDPALKNVPLMDLMRQRSAAKLQGDTAQLSKIEQAIAARVPSKAVGAKVTEWFGKEKAAQVMTNPDIPSLTGKNEFGEHLLVPNAAIEQAAALAQSAATKTDERLYKQVAQAYINNEIAADDLLGVLDAHKMSLTDFLLYHKEHVREGAQVLQRYSVLRKRLNALAETSPEAKKVLLDPALGGGAPTKAEEMVWAGRKWLDLARGSLILQPATVMRNISTQGVATAVEAFELALRGDLAGAANIRGAMRGSLAGAINVERPARKEMIDGLEKMGRFVQALPGKGDELARIFNAFPIESRGMQTFATPEGPIKEAYLGKTLDLLNTPNRIQENFFKRTIFSAHIKTWADRAGVDFSEAMQNPKMIPESVVSEATRRAGRTTFSAMPDKGTLGYKYVKLFQDNPALYLINWFPRFQANAARFIYEHSPLGLSRFATDRFREASGEARRFTDGEIAAQAASGALMLGAGMALRWSPYAGEHWYTVKTGDDEIDIRQGTPLERADLRAYAPFAAAPFLAEGMKNLALHGELRMSDQDLKAGAQALALRSGAGYSILDLWLGNDPVSSAPGAMERIVGNLLSSFTVPFRTLKDAVSGLEYWATGSSEEAKYRDIRESPILGPAAQNIPYVSRLLPAAPNPLVPGDAYRSDYPTWKQSTGVSFFNLTPEEAETQRLGLTHRTIAANTGVPRADRFISRAMAPGASQRVRQRMMDPSYRMMDREVQAGILNQDIDEARAEAALPLSVPTTPLGMQVYRERLKRSTKPADILQRRMLDRLNQR